MSESPFFQSIILWAIRKFEGFWEVISRCYSCFSLTCWYFTKKLGLSLLPLQRCILLKTGSRWGLGPYISNSLHKPATICLKKKLRWQVLEEKMERKAPSCSRVTTVKRLGSLLSGTWARCDGSGAVMSRFLSPSSSPYTASKTPENYSLNSWGNAAC